MMENAGLTNILVSPGVPYYHAVGKKVQATHAPYIGVTHDFCYR